MKLTENTTFYGGENIVIEEFASNNNTDYIPVSGGRSSQPDAISTFAPQNKLTEIPVDFSVEWLSTLENLAAYHSDISYALDNIVQLASTPHDIYFSDKIKPKQAIEMKKYLAEKENNWYECSSGVSSLKSDLLTQIVINGALSAEAYPDKNLKGIEQIVRIAPKNIRFVYDKTIDRYLPYQISNTLLSQKENGMIKLNVNTYKYIALRRYFQTPYATPPFISAIDALCTQKDMLLNFKNIMKKLGMLGFLSAEVTPPTQRAGETQEAYWQRCIDYLNNSVYPQLQKNLGKGFVAGFKDKHKFELQGNNMNVQGAEGLFNIVQSRIFAGVKQDPNMLGVNHSTTETFGRVVLAKLLSQVTDYQDVVDSFMAHVYLLELRLAGFNPGYVKVVSKKPMIGDQLKEEQTEEIKINNIKAKRDMGIISQEIAANELGYDEPYIESDVVSQSPVNSQNPNDTNAGGGTTPDANQTDPSQSSSNLKIKQLEYKYKKHIVEYNYCNEHKCKIQINKTNFEQFDKFKGTDLEKYIKQYFSEMLTKYKEASKSISKTLGDKLLNYSKDTPLETIQREAYLHILIKWESEFITPMKDVIENNITVVWEHFRKDKSIFNSKTPTGYSKSKFNSNDIADGVLDLDDFRAIQYMEQSDSMYLGKFITDKDTKKAIYKYLEDEYINGYLPIGNNKEALDKFKKTFEETVNLEAWKIRRIIDTSLNKIRNYAHVYYMSQSAVDKYEVLEMNDNLTCDYCAEMDGKVFEVKLTKQKIQKEVNAGAENISKLSPFITTQKIDDIKGKSASELQALGFNSPPYHPHCRGTIIAAFD